MFIHHFAMDIGFIARFAFHAYPSDFSCRFWLSLYTHVCTIPILFCLYYPVLAGIVASDAYRHVSRLYRCFERFSPVYFCCMTAVLEVFQIISLACVALRILYPFGTCYTVYCILLQLS